jgi:hypothetical protein
MIECTVISCRNLPTLVLIRTTVLLTGHFDQRIPTLIDVLILAASLFTLIQAPSSLALALLHLLQ